MPVTYEAATHTYAYDGAPVPGVSEILTTLEIRDTHHARETRRLPDGREVDTLEWGSAVHKAIALDAAGELDDTTLDPCMVAAVMTWREARRHLPNEAPIVEQPAYSVLGRFAGRPDLWYSAAGMIVEIKTGSAARWHAVQVAAYCDLVGASYGCIVYVDGPGIRFPDPLKMDGARQVWRAALRLWHWRSL